MNLEHYKAASEATDADERALIPGFKRTQPKQDHWNWERGMRQSYVDAIDAQPWDEQAERNRDLEHESRETEEREASGFWDCNEGESTTD